MRWAPRILLPSPSTGRSSTTGSGTCCGQAGALRDYEARIVACGGDEVMAIVRDITERKRAEEALLRLSSAVRIATDSIVITDLEGRIVEVNDATLKMYGTADKEDLLGKSAFDLIVPEDRVKAFAGMEETL